MDPRAWSIILTFLMAVAIILELLTPTMGGFTVGALAAAVGSVLMGWQYSEPFGYLMIAVNLVSFPLALWLGLHFLVRSPLALRQELTQGSQSAADATPLEHLLGKEGVAITPLRPGGAALIDNTRVDVVAEGKFVEPNTRIKVIHVEGNRVVVEPIS